MTAKLSTRVFKQKDGSTIAFDLEVTADNFDQAFQDLAEGIRAAEKHQFSLIPPAGSPPPPKARKNGNGHKPNPQGGTIHANRMTIEPRPDGRINVKWFAAGHRWPDLTTCTAPEILRNKYLPDEDLDRWTLDELMAAGDHKVDHVITWRSSEKLNSKGNPYKNIVKIE